MIAMNKNALAALLDDLRTLILKSRPAYRDFLGEVTEAKTTKILENVVLAETELMLPVADAAFSGFIAGKAYRVVLNGEEKSIVAKDFDGGGILSNVEDFLNLPNDYWALQFDFKVGKMATLTAGSFLGTTISVYYDETVTTQKWSVKKLAYELLPDRLLSALSAAANTARKALTAANAAQSTANAAQSTANAAQTAANAAQSTANAAQTTADAAQSTADNIVPAATSQGAVSAKTITDIGDISGLSGSKKEYKAKGLNIKVNSTVTVTTKDYGAVSMRWDGRRAVGVGNPPSGPDIILEYEVGTDTYTLRTNALISVTVEKMEYTAVPLSPSGTIALPYLQFPHILLYSNSGAGKLFRITVDDAGTLSATRVTNTTT